MLHINKTELQFLEFIQGQRGIEFKDCPVCGGKVVETFLPNNDFLALIDLLDEQGDLKVCDGTVKWQQFEFSQS